MQRVSYAAFKGVRLYSHAASLGDGVSEAVKLTPADKVKLPSGKVVVSDSHHDTHLHASKLDNGTRVISKDNGGSIARLTFLYKDGPVYESVFTAGASQFMRHMLNKDSVVSSEFVSKTLLQKAGLKIDAPQIINKSWISFSCEGFRETIAQAAVCDKYWQSLLFPRFSQDNMKEAKRLLGLESEELKRSNPRQYTLNLLHTTAFKGSPLGQSNLCPSYNMKYFKPDHMFDRWDRHYGFGNIAVVATNIDHHSLLHALQDSIWVARAHQKEGGIKAEPSKYVGGQSFDICRRSVEYDDQFDDVYETYTGYAFKAPGMSDLSGYAAARIIAAALNYATERVLVNSFSKKGVCAFYKSYKDNGLIGMITPASTAAQLKAFKEAIEQLKSASAEELQAFKTAALLAVHTAYDTRKGTQDMLLDTFTASGFPLDCADICAAISAVQPSDVSAVIDTMFSNPATLVHHGDSPAAPVLADL